MVLGKTHPDTLKTIMNMATVCMEGLKDFTKAEEMFRIALDGYEKSLGKDHESTKICVRNLSIFYSTRSSFKGKVKGTCEGIPSSSFRGRRPWERH